ncbi:MAG: hypothetical protein HQ478_16335 [Chloroflexi bacterium]|nr:hypothetical protein [Chloroflexota bacterium]
MAIVQRRVFYGKVGTAGALVEWANEMYGLISAKEPKLTQRVLTDHQSGRTDRMVVEFEAESLAALDAMIDNVMADLGSDPAFQATFAKLADLIDHAEVEQWTVH